MGITQGLVDALAERVDGWKNLITGLGVDGVDSRESTCAKEVVRLTDRELINLFRGDDITFRAVSALPLDSLSRGIEISIGQEEGGQDVATQLQMEVDRLKLIPVVRRAAVFGRLLGGAAGWIGVRDGTSSQEDPLNEEGLQEVAFLKMIDRRYLHPDPSSVNTDPFSPDFGQPMVYRVMGRLPGERGAHERLAMTRIHRSRLVFFGGAMTDDQTKEELDGWDDSVVQRMYDVMRSSGSAWSSISRRLEMGGYSTLMIDGLSKKMGAGQENEIRNRVRMMRYAQALLKTIVLDTNEQYERTFDQLSGVKDTLETFMMRVAASIPMPATVLWMKSPDGQNATGRSDADIWHAQCQSYRDSDLKHPIERILDLCAIAAKGPIGRSLEEWAIRWPELAPMNDKERSEVYERNARADALYIDREVLMPEEVALSRWRPEGYNPGELQIDREARERMLELNLERAENPPQLPPGPPSPGEEQPPPEGGDEEPGEQEPPA